MNGGLSQALAGEMKGIMGLAGLATQFLPPWAGDALAVGQAIMSGDPSALIDKYMPPEVKAAYDAFKEAYNKGGLKELIFPPEPEPDKAATSGSAPWAARFSDLAACSGGAGAITMPCKPTVLIGGLPAARVSDLVLCNGMPTDSIAKGEDTVLIGKLPAARMTDPTAHRGKVTFGLATVQIGKRNDKSEQKLNCDSCLKNSDAATISGSAIIVPGVEPCF